MAYEKQTWSTGDVITAEKLNHMEDGINEYLDVHYAFKRTDTVENGTHNYSDFECITHDVEIADIYAALQAGRAIRFHVVGTTEYPDTTQEPSVDHIEFLSYEWSEIPYNVGGFSLYALVVNLGMSQVISNNNALPGISLAYKSLSLGTYQQPTLEMSSTLRFIIDNN